MDNKIKDKISEILKENKKLIIAIEGPCASGKTTLSKEMENTYDCNVIHMDDFFLPFEKRTEQRLYEIGGNVNYERFNKEVAENIFDNKPLTYGKFDCSEGKITKQIKITPKKINIIEGVYSLHPLFSDIYNLKIFLTVDFETQIERLKTRSPEKLERFINNWIPKENEYFDKFQIKSQCDIIL